MNIQIFPYRLKKVGFVFFIIAFIMSVFYNAALPGINIDELGNTTNDLSEVKALGVLNAFTGGAFTNGLSILQFFSMFGIIIYIMSKEKVEDDYINKLRLETFQLTTLIFLISAVLLHTFYLYLTFTFNVIFLFVWCYIIIFFIKKRFSL